MNKLIFLLLMAGLSAFGAISPGVPPFSAAFKSVRTVQQFTNAVNGADPNDWIVIEPGTYYFPSPTLNLSLPHVGYYAHPGVTIVIGDGTAATGNPFGYSAAATNWFFGYADFIISNRTQLVSMSEPGALLYLECNSIWRKGTNMAVGIFEHDGGSLWVKWWDFCRTDPYDIYVNLFGNAVDANMFVRLEGPRWLWGDSMAEVGHFTTTGNATFIGEYAEQIPFGHVPSGGTFAGSFFGDGSVLRFDTIILGTNGVLSGITAGGTIPIFDVRQVKSAAAGRFSMFDPVSGMSGRWLNTTFTGPTGFDPLLFLSTDTPVLENCRIISGASATNSIRADGAMGVTVVGSLTLDKPVHNFIAVNGDALGFVHTNSYTGTNVFWNVGGHTRQFLDATNAMLLVVTNSAALLSGKVGQLTIVNNKATNMNVAISAAGLRVLGGPLATAVSFTVTNGRAASVSYGKLGTNNMLTVSQQQN